MTVTYDRALLFFYANFQGSGGMMEVLPDFHAMTDGELARTLAEALDARDYELVVFAESEVADRLDLSGDETETLAVDRWVEQHKGE